MLSSIQSTYHWWWRVARWCNHELIHEALSLRLTYLSGDELRYWYISYNIIYISVYIWYENLGDINILSLVHFYVLFLLTCSTAKEWTVNVKGCKIKSKLTYMLSTRTNFYSALSNLSTYTCKVGAVFRWCLAASERN